uniref:Uncharacterized protein n=1 Tax=Rhizophora mucronata TaxID=61149 RepID=A0A2P2NBV2_RHIMU
MWSRDQKSQTSMSRRKTQGKPEKLKKKK